MSIRFVMWCVILTATAFMLGCSPHQGTPPASSVHAATGESGQPAQINQITLKRFGHAEGAPFYEIVINRDGTVTYAGELNVTRLGRFESKVESEDFRRLEELVNRFRYFEMEDNYPMAPDAPGVRTSVLRGGQRKTIQDGWGSAAPVELWAIEMTIDGLAARITDWKPIK